jgi:hypothetical protein
MVELPSMHRTLIPAAILALQLTAAAAEAGEISFLGGDGASVERAILVKGAAGEGDGVAAEYAWLRQHLPEGSRPLGQGLLNQGERAYDCITVALPDGRQQSFYFDITEFFGHY